jgi:cytochrome c553
MYFVVIALLISFSTNTAAVAKEDEVIATAERMGTGNFVAGKSKSNTELCQGCHGDDGASSSMGVPHLAGQYAEYLMKQLRNFKSGERKHPVMNPMAEGLAEVDQSDISAYFANNNAMQGNGAGASEIAKDLFTRGDTGRNILPCKSCHGEKGKGQVSAIDIYPMIGGQRKFYLREQLLNWRSGARTNSPGGVMNIIAKSLSDAEIDALSDYISGL